ncbi:hypothetical protein N7463_002375 [Penicillium fimorum]|uniref:Uncharacterized protein n=1 Tax=Penicillium fimorum TaxID=1882269 RepID=A0A9X0C8A1_9EURO|nr:hypothetical protein N7463_002375 [Penicillium fimorum]
MPRTTICLQLNMKPTPFKNQRIWFPLRLDDFHLPQAELDRQSVLDIIRSVYDPLLAAWLAEPGHTWNNIFQRKLSSNVFEQQVIARKGELPSSVQSIETDTVLGQILLDILKYYRFTDPDWRVPMPAGTVNLPNPLDILAEAASEAQPILSTPPEILAGAASEAQPILTTSALDILAGVAGTMPHLPVPGPTAAPAPVPFPITPAVSDITQASTPTSPTASDITQPGTPIASVASPTPLVTSPALGAKRGNDDEPEQPAKKKRAVSPK